MELTVLGLVDLHWSPRVALELPDLRGIDLVLLGGDLTNFRGVAEARTVIEQVRAAGPQVLAVCGNCDRPEIEGYLEEAGVALDRRVRVQNGVRFLGLSGGLPFGGCPYERTEEEYALLCAELAHEASRVRASGPTILVSHQPPFGTRCDRTRGRHVGSRSVRDFVLEQSPDLVLCGHIHESRGRDLLGRSTVVNPGPWLEGNVVRFRVSEGKVTLDDP